MARRWVDGPVVDDYIVPTADELENDDIDRLVDQVDNLEAEIRQALRQSQSAMSLAVGVGAVAVALAAGKQGQVDPSVYDILWLALPTLLSVAAVYNLNTASQVSALAELRDRLSLRANRAARSPFLLVRIVEDNRRGSTGTVAAYGLAAAVLVGALLGGVAHAMARGVWWLTVLQVLISCLVIAALAVACWEFASTRAVVNEALDKVFPDDRPKTAPPPLSDDERLIARIRQGITVGVRSEPPPPQSGSVPAPPEANASDS